MTDRPDRDRGHMERAAELARRGWGRVHPNPMVGCVIVRDGERIAEGWHRELGGPHAEVDALERAGERARGATVHVSLEPCAHHGRTPPCTEALIRAGVARVVFGAADPGAQSGGGAEVLRTAGIEVEGPVWSAKRAYGENPGFFHDAPERPWTLLKLAVSIDGAVAERPGAPTALTGDEAWARTHRLRAGVDAILVGAGTVRADAPRLTARGEPRPRVPPVRVILDPGDAWLSRAAASATPGDGSLLDPDGSPLWVAATRPAPSAAVAGVDFAGGPGGVSETGSAGTGSATSGSLRRWLHVSGAESVSGTDPASGDEPMSAAAGAASRATTTAPSRESAAPVNLAALMRELRDAGIGRLLCEGGARLGRSLVAAGLVDRLVLITAPCTLGSGAVSAFPLQPGRWEPAGPPEALGRDVWCAWDHGDSLPGDAGAPPAAAFDSGGVD